MQVNIWKITYLNCRERWKQNSSSCVQIKAWMGFEAMASPIPVSKKSWIWIPFRPEFFSGFNLTLSCVYNCGDQSYLPAMLTYYLPGTLTCSTQHTMDLTYTFKQELPSRQQSFSCTRQRENNYCKVKWKCQIYSHFTSWITQHWQAWTRQVLVTTITKSTL